MSVRKLLLVDDDPDEKTLLEWVLKRIRQRTELLAVQSGEEALLLVKSKLNVPPDIIFLDVNMPKMSGRECLMEFKKLESLKGTPIIIFTTSSNPKEAAEMINLGADLYQTKPSSMEDLKRIVESIFDMFVVKRDVEPDGGSSI